VAGGDTAGRPGAVDTLSNLFVKSLLVADANSDILLYRMFDTTRTFAAERLQESGEFEIIFYRHAVYVRDALRDAERDWDIEEGTLWLGKYGHLIDDVRGALDWAMSPTGDQEIGGQISGASATLWFCPVSARGIRQPDRGCTGRGSRTEIQRSEN
jgi:predicted ATPase